MSAPSQIDDNVGNEGLFSESTTATATVPLAGIAVVPEVALVWTIRNAVIADVELAQLSNVCRAWRYVVKNAVLEEALVTGAPQQETEGRTQLSTSRWRRKIPKMLLLLPSMVRSFERNQQQQQQQLKLLHPRNTNTSTASTPTKRQRARSTGGHSDVEHLVVEPDESFCAVWLHPDGIQTMKVRLKTPGSSSNNDKDSSSSSTSDYKSCSPDKNIDEQGRKKEDGGTGASNDAKNDSRFTHPSKTIELSQTTQLLSGGSFGQVATVPAKKQLSTPQRQEVSSPLSRGDKKRTKKHRLPPVTCCNEWRGYRTPFDVLKHFGYHNSFVEDVFASAAIRISSNLSSALGDWSPEKKSTATVSMENGNVDDNNNNIIVTNSMSGGMRVNNQSSQNDDVTDFRTNMLSTTLSQQQQPLQGGRYSDTNFAVRGATVARPEGYCFCVDDKIAELKSKVQHLQLLALERANAAAAVAVAPAEQRDAMQEPESATTSQAATTLSAGGNSRARHKQSHKDKFLSDSKHSHAELRCRNYERASEQYRQQRKELRRDVMPRLVYSSPDKNPIYKALPPDFDGTDRQMNMDPENPQGMQVRCLQFLNAMGSHAVCMTTPHFACGPLPEPITIFLVGIATEDGCFMSGLHHRFEVGHSYPDTAIAEGTEMSVVCLATEAWQQPPMPQHAVVATDIFQKPQQQQETERNVSPTTGRQQLSSNAVLSMATSVHDVDMKNDDGCHSSSEFQHQERSEKRQMQQPQSEQLPFHLSGDEDEDDSSSSPSSSSIAFDCKCVFQGVGERLDELDEDTANQVFHGRTGPGAWHCYVVICDGKRSLIRVDGLPEPIHAEGDADDRRKQRLNYMQASNNVKIESCADVSMSEDRGSMRMDTSDLDDEEQTQKEDENAQTDGLNKEGLRRPMLDGLTIGSDHCFGMSLCCGHGSGGGGEGAIAELAVFHGRMALPDIEHLENVFMTKHGIPCRKRLVGETLWLESAWEREAQALMLQPPPVLDNLQQQQQRPRHATQRPHKLTTGGVPLRFLSRHRSVAWRQSNPVTGEPIHIQKIGSKITSAGDASSSDW